MLDRGRSTYLSAFIFVYRHVLLLLLLQRKRKSYGEVVSLGRQIR